MQVKKVLNFDTGSDTYQAIFNHQKRHPHNQNLYDLMDSVCFDVGIAFGILCVENDNHDTIGYIPVIDIKPQNHLKMEAQTIELTSPYKSFSKCINHLSKEVYYKLKTIQNLNQILNS